MLCLPEDSWELCKLFLFTCIFGITHSTCDYMGHFWHCAHNARHVKNMVWALLGSLPLFVVCLFALFHIHIWRRLFFSHLVPKMATAPWSHNSHWLCCKCVLWNADKFLPDYVASFPKKTLVSAMTVMKIWVMTFSTCAYHSHNTKLANSTVLSISKYLIIFCGSV